MNIHYQLLSLVNKLVPCQYHKRPKDRYNVPFLKNISYTYLYAYFLLVLEREFTLKDKLTVSIEFL